MNAETIKATATYIYAGFVIIGGFFILYLTRLEPTADELRLVIAGFMGSALTFLFGQETQTRTARQTASATLAGATSQPTVTTTAGPPQTTTVAPATSAPPVAATQDPAPPADATSTFEE